jgi:tRNA pseudouridine55 synthase
MKGILLVDKAAGSTSFHIVSLLRRLTHIETIGHAGTLDPFATGLMVLLIGREYTKKSNSYLTSDKSYRATLTLGTSTDTYDIDGQITSTSPLIPTSADITQAISAFQGNILQTPPMFSAKKIQGKKLCDLARRGITIERQPVPVTINITLISYTYPTLTIDVTCSKGTYIRSLAHDLGLHLETCAHLSALTRTRSGTFLLANSIPQSALKDASFDITPHLLT